MTLKEILELPKEERLDYVLKQKGVRLPQNIYELPAYVETVRDFTTIMSSVEESQRLIGWYEGQAKAYREILDLLNKLGLKTIYQ